MKLTDRQLNKYFGHHEEHQYKGFNRSLGCRVESKEHFVKLLDERGFVPQEIGERLAEDYHKKSRKEYSGISKKAAEICYEANTMVKSGRGSEKIPGRMVKGMEEVGMANKLPPIDTRKLRQGGFF